MDYSNESSSVGSSSNESNYDLEDSGEDFNVEGDVNIIQPYVFEPVDVPEHKKNRHVPYRQLVRRCWGVLGKEIRVPLPSCAVS